MTKGVANVAWPGNPTPRIAEIHSGMMNAIGLQNPGMEVFCERDLPYLQQFDTKVIVNVCGHAPEEYLAVVERLADEPADMLEINISCPNVNANFLAFGQDPDVYKRQMENHTIQELFSRKSVRVFSDEKITGEEKRLILEAAIQAPTAGNMSLFSILDIQSQEIKNILAKRCDNQNFIAEAPLVLVFLADYQRWCDVLESYEMAIPLMGQGDLFLAMEDCMIAAQNAVVAAESMGCLLYTSENE